MAYGQEFTPEFDKTYLDSIIRPIEDRGASDEGRTRSEAAARGLSGQLQEGDMVSGVRSNTANTRSSAISDFANRVAEKKYSERMMDKQEGFHLQDQANANDQAEKDRQWQEHLANLGYQFADATRNNQNRADKIAGEQGLVIGEAKKYGEALLSGVTGGYF